MDNTRVMSTIDQPTPEMKQVINLAATKVRIRLQQPSYPIDATNSSQTKLTNRESEQISELVGYILEY
jgi:hypothetical protein